MDSAQKLDTSVQSLFRPLAGTGLAREGHENKHSASS